MTFRFQRIDCKFLQDPHCKILGSIFCVTRRMLLRRSHTFVELSDHLPVCLAKTRKNAQKIFATILLDVSDSSQSHTSLTDSSAYHLKEDPTATPGSKRPSARGIFTTPRAYRRQCWVTRTAPSSSNPSIMLLLHFSNYPSALLHDKEIHHRASSNKDLHLAGPQAL